jgi:hypothetical protein
MPTNCPAILQNYEIQCADGQAGVKKYYITEHANVSQSGSTEASGVLTAMALNDGKKFWVYDQEFEVAFTTENINPSPNNGTITWDQTVFMKLNKRSASLSYSIRALAHQRVCIIAVENTGTAYVYGLRNGLKLAPSPSNTGTSMNDHNGYDLTFTGKEAVGAPTVSTAILDTLIV